ncbi:hypothetical protein F2P79_005298 [Pimephales promelas]|nr:hypothetical protein F2P79_005298 [Pimephales promelas]
MNRHEVSAELSEHAVTTHSFSFCLFFTPGTLHQRGRFEILWDKISIAELLRGIRDQCDAQLIILIKATWKWILITQDPDVIKSSLKHRILCFNASAQSPAASVPWRISFLLTFCGRCPLSFSR